MGVWRITGMGAVCAKIGLYAFLCSGFVNVSYGACPCSIWNNAPTPGIVDSGDTGAVELGVTFKTDVAGTVSAVRFYKGSGNLGTHVGHLWSASGSPLASVTFANETASGWQQATFVPPVSILANTPYVVSYFAPRGHYPDDTGYFASAVDNPPLHAFADGAGALNGVYVYGSSGGFPTQSWQSSNYWVDFVFTPFGSGTPPLISSVSAAPGTTSATVTWTTDT